MIELGKLVGDLATLSPQEKSIQISDLCVDSRLAIPGCLFIALAGTKVNGAKFISMAIEKGARAILVGENVDIGEVTASIIRVPDPRLALACLAARYFPRQPENIVAVTGTAGKTSVAEFTRQIWNGCKREAAFIGTTGVVARNANTYGNLTTPDPVTLHKILDKMAGEGISHVAMEASSHGLDQKRLHGVQLKAAGFTNLGRDHLDYHANIDEYFQAKMKLFEELLPRNSPAVIFADDPFSSRAESVAKECGHVVLSVGRGGNYLTLKRVEHSRHFQIAEIVHQDKTYRVNFPLAGDFQIANGLVAAGLALASGETAENVMGQLERIKGASGRLELIGKKENGAPVYVDYAHKPEALENVLISLRPFTTGKLVLVFGCGGDRDPGKRPIMGEISNRLADRVIVTDDNPRTENPRLIRSEILAAVPSAQEIGDRREAIHIAINGMNEGDCLVVAGKGHETGQIVGDETLEFSDQYEVRAALGIEGAGVLHQRGGAE